MGRSTHDPHLTGTLVYTYGDTRLFIVPDKKKETESLPVFTPVSFFRTGTTLFLLNDHYDVARDVVPVPLDRLHSNNKVSGSVQNWCRGVMKGGNTSSGTFEIAHTFDSQTRGPRIRALSSSISFSPAQLLSGSQLLPKGTPVVFQTAYSFSEKKTSVVFVRLDLDLVRKSEGPQLNADMHTYFDNSLGQVDVVVGGYSDFRSVPLAKLVEKVPDIARSSLSGLLTACWKVFEERVSSRRDELRLARQDSSLDNEVTVRLDHEVRQLETTLKKVRQGEPCVVLVSPSFFSRDAWVSLVNLFYSDGGRDLVTLFDWVSPGLTPSSVERETGVASRLVRQRKTGDYLQSITLASNLGHFLSAPPYKPPLDTPLVPLRFPSWSIALGSPHPLV